MPNRLSMAKINSIETLHRSGHSNREIARLLAIDRGTVNKYIQQLKRAAENQPDPQTGSGAATGSESRPDPQNENLLSAAQMCQLAEELAAEEPPVRNGPRNLCDPYREIILEKLDQGLSLVRIHQDLQKEHGLICSYHSVWRFVQGLEKRTPLPVRG